MSTTRRIALGSAAIIGALFAGGLVHDNIKLKEGYAPVATVPVKGDPCTGGYGSTTHLDGSPVKCGDKFSPAYASKRTTEYLLTQHSHLNACITVPLTPVEYAMLADHAYQYGVGATCKSSMVQLANRGDYAGACKAHLKYRFVRGFDCSTPGNKVCAGVWKRTKHRYEACMQEVGSVEH